MKKSIVVMSLALLVAASTALGGCSLKSKNISAEAAKEKASKFINSYLIQQGYTATISDVTKAYGLYKLKVTVGNNQSVDSYISMDGKLFFPQALDIDQVSGTQAATSTGNNASADNGQKGATALPKTDKPKIELFVMSYCPYGTQIEKGLMPVVKALGSKIDFELKFCDYSMHGDKELKENMTQYCITKNDPSKLTDYMNCFLDSGDSASCLDKAKIDKAKNASCVSETDSKYKIMENSNNKVDYNGSFPSFPVYKADNQKYNVAGSPTLIINGQEASSDRDPASLLKTVCSAFNNQPDECKAQLSSSAPAAGFGSGNGGSASGSAGCGQ